MATRSPLTILRFEKDGNGRLYGVIGYKLYEKAFYNLGFSSYWELVGNEPVGVLDFAAGRAFGLRGEEIGENAHQSRIDGVARLLDAGRGWPHKPSVSKTDELDVLGG